MEYFCFDKWFIIKKSSDLLNALQKQIFHFDEEIFHLQLIIQTEY